MRFVEFLQGKWLGHPLHPALVHVPVGAWVMAGGVDLALWMGLAGEWARPLALWCVGAGLAGAVVAVPPGVADWSLIKQEKPAWKMTLYHLGLNLLAAIVWAVNFGLRFEPRDELTSVSGAVLVTSFIGVVLLLGGAYLGKLIVFTQGIGVARASKKKWRAIAARSGANLAPEE